MIIKGIENMDGGNIMSQIQQGGKFVIYTYCFSVVLMTFRRSSSIYFIKAGEGSVKKGLKYTLLTFLVGWWGIPWGPIYSIGAFITNFKGGKDVTNEVLAALSNQNAS
ncbi:hypothetical protein C173_23192 [Paenibacillus sp. FSL R7-277]|uniref:hypothetical protein n=1 Tax=Paenibacillus sp. FSL R7-277 TaxID=1227352 RepID=UPI0003E1C85B|nr:hypothetical protein [Paenibacillus sp. FSL R7-277]ETT63252.1 hypothetical protein C173_23192 [Paenibacillus sp. FSL R7-277]